jgi:protocatechuate 3,4-dioxygenase beta subunit
MRRKSCSRLPAVLPALLLVGSNAMSSAQASGRYAFPSLAAGRNVPDALRHGDTPSDAGPSDDGVVDRGAASSRRDLELTKQRRLTGRVVDEAGAPVAGALVAVAVHGSITLYSHADAYGDWGATANTAADGGFALHLPSDGSGSAAFGGDPGLLVLKQGYAAGRVEPARLAGAAARPVEVTLARGIELAGRVTDAEGTPLPGVAVALAEDSAFAGGALSYLLLSRLEGEGWTKSGADGRFSVRVQPVLHHVAFRKAGHAPKLVRSHDPRGDASLDVVLDPAAEVRGRVTFSDGGGVPDAAVELRQQPGLVASTATTDGDGGFVLGDLAPGPYELVVTREDAGLYETRGVDAPASDVRVELGPRGALRGRVVDARSREPVPRFSLALGREPGESAPEWRMPRHLEVGDAAGSFVFAGIPAGEVTLVVRAEGYVPTRVEGLVVPDGGELAELEVALDAGATIRGRVTTHEGKPIADASVAVVDDAGDAPSAESDEHGAYELAGVRPGQVTLDFRGNGYRRSRRTLEVAPPLVTLDATLSRGLSVAGCVVSDGAGVANASVAASSGALDADHQAAVSDARGRFTIEGLAPGRYSITASADGLGEATLEDVDVETARALRLVLERRASAILAGSVSGLPVGEEVLGGMVIATAEDGQSEYAPVDTAGAFRMEKAPAGHVMVRAVATSFSGATRSSRTNELTLTPGSENHTVIEFAGGTVIAGVVTRDGVPVSDATVTFQAADDGDLRSSARSDARGRYEVAGVEPGPYRVAVGGAGGALEMEYLVTGSDRLDIDLSGAALRGLTLDAASGQPVAGVEVSFWRLGGGRETTPESAATSNAHGEFATRSLREGRYRVLTAKQGYGQELREVELSRDSAGELVLELAAVEGLSVRVVDARDDRPLDATVVVRDLTKRIVANRHGGVAADGTLNVALAGGSYLLSTSATGYGTVTLPVTAPGQGLRVGLTPGGTLVLESERDLRGRIRLVGSDGEEYVRCWCNGIADIRLAGRRTTVPHVTPGSYTLEVVDARGTTSEGGSVVIREGAVSTLTIP